MFFFGILETEEGEFVIVSSDQKKWYFSASNDKERSEWVEAIAKQIGRSLQDQTSNRRPISARTPTYKADVQSLRSVAGNEVCADCSAESNITFVQIYKNFKKIFLEKNGQSLSEASKFHQFQIQISKFFVKNY